MKKYVFMFVGLLLSLMMTVGVQSQSMWDFELPHITDPWNSDECLVCHLMKSDLSGLLPLSRGTEQETLCATCHNPTGLAASMSDIGNHNIMQGGDNQTIDCSTCHNPHAYEQSTDPDTGITADNIKLLRSTISDELVPGVQNPVVYQQPSQFIFADAPYSGICQSCHTATGYHRNDGSADTTHQAETDCLTCHAHQNGFAGGLDHKAAGAVVSLPACVSCHEDGGEDPVSSVHNNNCGLCHVNPDGGGPMIEPYETNSPSGGDCSDCHGTMEESHQAVDHSATPGRTGSVTIFNANAHTGRPTPYDIPVDCDLCHNADLSLGHGNNCATCHPTPLDSIGTWDGECGACHQAIHADSIQAHLPYEAMVQGNDCMQCHSGGWSPLTQTICLRCHAASDAGDVTPPVTTSDALASYIGPAVIAFEFTDQGLICAGTPFYRLDGGPTLTGENVTITAPGSHTLEFWAFDQSGNIEAPNSVNFTITEDTTPPVTTSNAQASYFNGGTITLTASDASTLGVKATYYRLNGGPIQTGTTVSIPAVSGVIDYDLDFWSEDWSGNVEATNSVSFTVTSGTATLRLVWGDSDAEPPIPPANPGDRIIWNVLNVVSGESSNPGWDGIVDVEVSVSSTTYYVLIQRFLNGADPDVFYWPSVLADTPDDIIVLRY